MAKSSFYENGDLYEAIDLSSTALEEAQEAIDQAQAVEVSVLASQAASASSASAASTSATSASASAASASTSATNASNSATAAAGSASNASTSATNASNSATAAAGSASSAATSATNAGNSATAAAGSASAAAASATAAANSAAEAASYALTDGDKGDIVISGSGTVWTVESGAIGTSKLGGDITAVGKALLDDATSADQRTTLGVGTMNSPQFAAVEIGHDTDTTLSRVSAGIVAVEGVTILRSGDSPYLVTIELGHASDTTLSRISPGVIGVEGVAVLTNNTGVKLSGQQTLTGGWRGTSYSLGTITGNNQTISLDALLSNFQHVTFNGSLLTGALTITPPTGPASMCLEVVNGGSGVVGLASFDFSGWDEVVGLTNYTNTNGNKYHFDILVSQTESRLSITKTTG